MEKNCDNCAYGQVSCIDLPPCTDLNVPCTDFNGLAQWRPIQQPARKPQDEFVDVPLILPDDLKNKVDGLAAQCGLTADQMASAMIEIASREETQINSNVATPRKPQCTKRPDLFRELARVMEMCGDGPLNPGWCVKIGEEHFSLMGVLVVTLATCQPECVEFAIAIIDGQPVFAGTEFYKDGKKFTMGNHHSGLGFEGCTLSPPKPETISINGVEVKAPHFVGYSFVFVKEKFTVNVEYKNQADAVAFKAALEGKKP